MMITDPVGDFLTRLRNAIQRNHEEVVMPSTRMIASIAEILKREGFVEDFSVVEQKPQNELVVKLKYVNGQSAITELERVSKPGIRRYRGYREIKPIKSGLGISIYSTPQGLKTGEEARKERLGGEYICNIS